MKGLFIILFVVVLTAHATPTEPVNHKHGERSHIHPLPASGINHNHNQARSQKSSREKAKKARHEAYEHAKAEVDQAILNAQNNPGNLKPGYLGDNSRCNKGFKKQDNDCVEITIPKNGRLNYLGTDWTCKKGFQKKDNGCVVVSIPQNGKLNYLGNDWDCRKGFKKRNNQCIAIKIPQNGKLNYLGNDWDCNNRFKKVGQGCVPMTNEEVIQFEAYKRAVLMERRRRRALGVTGDHCETEHKTNANVCVEITGGDLDCNKSYSGDYYRDCDITLDYIVRTDYKGGSSLGVDVGCSVEIEYQGRDFYSSRSDSDSSSYSHSLYSDGSENRTVDFNLSFLSYNEVVKAKVSSIECEIKSVDLW